MTKIIGINGSPGSNKMFYAFRIIQQLRIRGYNAQLGSIITKLYEETTNIIDDYSQKLSPEIIAQKYNLTLEECNNLLKILKDNDYGEKSPIYHAYNRRNTHVRKFMDYLGTNIRRAHDEDYYIKNFYENLDKEIDFVIVVDLAFLNEAEFIRKHDGYLIRVELDDEQKSYMNPKDYKYGDGLKAHHIQDLKNYLYFNEIFYKTLFNGKKFGKELEKHYSLNTVNIDNY